MPGGDFEKRTFERIPAGEDVSISYGNMFYSGTILNLSKKGLLISTKKCFPVDSTSAIFIGKKENHVTLFAKIKRITKLDEYYNGIGFEILDSPRAFLDFIETLKPL